MSGKFASALLRALPPETAHNLVVSALKTGLVPSPVKTRLYSNLKTTAFGISFSNPIGLAAGFDKNAETLGNIFYFGFGFAEVGTVTPLPQTGNPKPRIFRLPEDSAVINRLGFNNDGIDTFLTNMSNSHKAGIIGVNIGKNKDTQDPISDYVKLIRPVYDWCDYITVNISSPNTPGLRDLQDAGNMAKLVSAVVAERERIKAIGNIFRPILFKISPDLNEQQAEDIADIALGYKIDGLIISNTTISRPQSLVGKHKGETGGLSGKPLFALSTAMLSYFYKLTKGRIPLIGVGGVSSGKDAYEKIKAGASLVQVYSGLVYNGFGMVENIKRELSELITKDGLKSVNQAVGVSAALN